MQQIKKSVRLDIEHEIELARILIRQRMTALNASGVQQYIDSAAALTYLLDRLGYRSLVGQVEAEVVRSPASRAHGIDGTLSCNRSFQTGQLFFYEGWRCTLAARLNAGEQIAFQIFSVGNKAFEVRIFRIRLRHQIKEIERSAGSSSQVGSNSRDDASRRARDYEDGVLIQDHAGLAILSGPFLKTDRPALVCGVSDLDRSWIVEDLVDQKAGDLSCTAVRFEINDFDQRFRTLPLVCLAEAADRAAQRGHGSGFVVSVMPAQPRPGHKERSGGRNLVVQRTHRGI